MCFILLVSAECQFYYNNSCAAFRFVSGRSIAPVSLFLFIFNANFGHFIPDNYDLVGVGGADGGVGAWGGCGGKREGVVGGE